ncbi:hypothetical protein BDV25DRAFT_139521 [Aspergillus avenaceus]|uniref:Sex determining protein n=1 Tax=Aspergillus avenaceus TaxID=36643 RepID=A0A5N6TWZ4_ASPAV|nr:hypothetical protein BDV25DRAFT_139521 [Aspergillus avenaceus]
MSRPHNAPPTALPTISSSLRMQGGAVTPAVGPATGSNPVGPAGQRGSTRPQHQGLSVVAESRVPAESIETSDSDQSDVASGTRDAPGTDSADQNYTPSPRDIARDAQDSRRGVDGGPVTTSVTGVGTGRAIGSTGRSSIMDRVMADEDMDSSGMAGDTPRKHGKRLTTLEEVSLFDICNQHAREFGQRSNLCKWWMTVTAEFTRDQGHPYSWHSVRRKVELVTKQRMKYLEEQREKGSSANEDLSNPRWRAAVDAWIPTWQRWEDAEARRIEKRDSRRSRKRKERSWEPMWHPSHNPNNWRQTASPTENQSQTQPPRPPPPPSVATQSTVRLPPGFENMFGTAPDWSFRQPPSQSVAPSTREAPIMMNAVLETLGKLNKHLDAVNSEPRSTSIVASLSANPDPQHAISPRSEQSSPQEAETLDRDLSSSIVKQLKRELRQELRDELRTELEKDRAALEEKLDSVQRTQEMILDMLRQEPA